MESGLPTLNGTDSLKTVKRQGVEYDTGGIGAKMRENQKNDMLIRRPIPKTLLIFLALATAMTRSEAAEVKVTLFGQPCVMSGPLKEAELKNIHLISPERTAEFESLDEGRRALERVRAPKAVPAGLEVYRERMARRLEARLAFLEGLELARKEGKATSLLGPAKRHMSDTGAKALEAKLKAIESKGRAELGNLDTIEQLRFWYEENIASDPEEEFHRATRRMKVRYTCTLEESAEQ